MPRRRQSLSRIILFALAVVYRIDTNHGEPGLVRVGSADTNKPLAVLTVRSAVTEQQQPGCVAWVVHHAGHATGVNPFLAHGAPYAAAAINHPPVSQPISSTGGAGARSEHISYGSP